MNPYKYIDEGKTHLHTFEGKPLIGTSTVAKESVNKGDGLMQWFGDLAALDALGSGGMLESEHLQLVAEYEDAQKINDWKAKSNAMRKIDGKYKAFASARKAAIRKRDGSAAVGTARHGVLESYIAHCIEKGGTPVKAEHEGIQMFIDWALAEVDTFYFTEANCFSAKLWLGGIADIGLKLKNGAASLTIVAGATSFVFPAQPNNTSYAVTTSSTSLPP